MPKLLIKKKDGSVHIREKSNESAETIEKVHLNKVKTWLALSESSRKKRGATLEEIIAAVIQEMQGKTFKPDKIKTHVTLSEYEDLVRQCHNKRVPTQILDNLVEVVEKDENKKIEALVQEVIRNG